MHPGQGEHTQEALVKEGRILDGFPGNHHIGQGLREE